jgi:polysaccharide deacetylase 2 family uncharacterized protein YibQ
MKKKYLEYGLLTVLILILCAIIFLYINFEEIVDSFQENSNIEQNTKIVNTYENNALLIKKLQTILENTKEELDNMEHYELMSESSDYETNINTIPQKPKDIIFKQPKDDDFFDKKPKKIETKAKKFNRNNPKLAIIVDDIIIQSQVNALNALGLKLNLSFLPPNKKHPNSANIAKKQKSHLVHIPLEAFNYNKKNYNILKDTDSYETIEKEVVKLKKLYPHAKYFNNHTGSKFTSNLQAMKKLIYALDKNGLRFIDSRTSKYTKAIEAAKSLNIDIMSRKIFLDNMANVNYIRKQIKKAVKMAKQKGFVIAICHPKSATVQALAMSKKILEDVELVYINDI